MQALTEEERFNQLAKEVTIDVKSPKWLKAFLKFLSWLPFPLGTIIFALFGVDCIKVLYYCLKNKTGQAIETIYNSRNHWWKGLWNIGDAIWRQSANVKSVLGRGKFVERVIPILLEKTSKNSSPEEKIIFVSLGSGAGIKLLNGISSSNADKRRLKLALVDNDAKELESAKRKTVKMGLETAVFCQTADQFLTNPPEPFSIVEMVGLSEYIEDTLLEFCGKQIFKNLKPNGLFLGANFVSDEEEQPTHKVVRWPKLFYRPKEKLIGFLKNSGFEKIWTGDCGALVLWVAEK